MKKIILGVAIALNLSADGMIVPRTHDNDVIRATSGSKNIQKLQKTTLVKAGGNPLDVASDVNFRKVENIEIVDDQVEIQVQDYTKSGNQLMVAGSSYTKEYPLERKVTHYDYEFEYDEMGRFISVCGYPIEERFVTINLDHADRSGKIILDEAFKNTTEKKNFTPYIRRTGQYEDHDAEHFSKAFTEIYIKEKGQEIVVSQAKVRGRAKPIPYVKLAPEITYVGSANPLYIVRRGRNAYIPVSFIERWQRPGRENSILKEKKQKLCLLERKTIDYEHDEEDNVSYPIEKLFVQLKDDTTGANKKIVVDKHFVNRNKVLPHHIQETGRFENDDKRLRAKPYTRKYIIVEGKKKYISEPEIREDAKTVRYTRTDTPVRKYKDGEPEMKRYDFLHYCEYLQRFETAEEWRRPDGSIFTKWGEMFEVVERSALPPAVSAQAERYENQTISNSGPSNEFERFGHFIGGGCEIM